MYFSNTFIGNDGCNYTGVNDESGDDKVSVDGQSNYKNEEANNEQFMTGKMLHKSGHIFDYDFIDSSAYISTGKFQDRQLDTMPASRKVEVSVHYPSDSFLGRFPTVEDRLSTCRNYLDSNIHDSIDKKRNSQNSKNKNCSSFTHNSDASFNKAKDAGTALLPPCRICGARASGFHYGVNSCEACKGFFRRALKRPTVFNCSNDRKCDIKGNKRSTCRFCRYNRCLELGMSKESIKTGRYSHKKRTRDTIEVKNLLKSPNVINNDTDLDTVIKHLLAAHDSTLTSTTHVPKNLIYQRQLEYHNICLLRKQFGLRMTSCIDPPYMHDKSSKCPGDKDDESSFSQCVKLSAPSRSSSQLSSDSGFVDENDAGIHGIKAALSENEIDGNNEGFPDSLSESRYHAREEINRSPYVNTVAQSGNHAVKNHKDQCRPSSAVPTPCDNTCLSLNTQQECCDYKTCIHSGDVNVLTTQLSRGVELCSSNGCPYETENKQTDSQMYYNPETADKIIENCANSVNNSYKISSTNSLCGENRNSSEKICYGSLNNERCMGQSNGIHSNRPATEDEHILCTDILELLTEDAIRDLHTSEDTTFVPNSLLQNYSSETLCRSSSNTMVSCIDSTKKRMSHDNTQGRMAETKYSPTVKAKTDLSKKLLFETWKDSTDMRKKSREEIIQRAKKWTREYIDFAMQIPGFSSLPCQDQAALLKHAWDEVWILGTCRSHNSDLGVAIAPCGTCYHVEEMEMAWGKNYTRIAFDMAGKISRENLTPELITVLKAICIISPDRCPITTSRRVTEIHWLVVSCLLRHLEVIHPGDKVIFPRLISILTSLRELSECARKDLERGLEDYFVGSTHLS